MLRFFFWVLSWLFFSSDVLSNSSLDEFFWIAIVVMQLKWDVFLQFCPFRLKQRYLLSRIRLWLHFVLQTLGCVMRISGTGLCVLVFCRFLLRWICHDFVGLRCQGMGDWSCFLLLWWIVFGDVNCWCVLVVLVSRLCVLLRKHHRHGIPRFWEGGLLLWSWHWREQTWDLSSLSSRKVSRFVEVGIEERRTQPRKIESGVNLEVRRSWFWVKARVRFALPYSWLNVTGSQLRLCTYPGLALGRS